MKQLSLWAHHHKVGARIIIIFIYFFLNVTGLLLGDVLYSLNIELATSFSFLAVVITIAGVILYPSKKKKYLYRNFYTRQKCADAVLAVATFLFIIYAGNSVNTNRNSFYASAYAMSIMDGSTVDHANNISGKNITSKKLSERSWRKSIRSTLKAFRKKYKESTKTEKVLLIVLTLLLGAGLILFMMGLTCSISCSGSEALAAIVGIVGVGAIIFGAAKLIQRISRGKPKDKATAQLR